MHQIRRRSLIALTLAVLSCVPAPGMANRESASGSVNSRARVRAGITVLLEDSVALINGKRVGLLTNQTGIDERGRSDIDLLYRPPGTPGPRLVALFSPEHGIRGVEDRSNIASGRDERTGLPIHSLYNPTTIEPPDSALTGLDALIIDLQDLGTRTWTYPASMVYAMRAAARNKVTVVVLDRPNPITGGRVEGPLLDSAQTYAGSHSTSRRAQPVSLYPLPLRHGMTMGELALMYNEVLAIGADLHVIPADGWRRAMWFDDTGLPWVKPSPNMPSLTSATLYPGIVPFEGSNLSVGRGTPDAFQRVGAPWLDARRASELLNDRGLAGVKFEAQRLAPVNPTDRKYGGVEIPWIRIVVTDRDRVHAVRVGAAILWAVAKTNPDSLQIRAPVFDERMGPPRVREALVRGEDPDTVMDREVPAAVAFDLRVRRFKLYR
ncbi:MAG: exo-beta-N-acetylmuramidase NamZ family protein [Gemmatimonadaceae bacterium]